MLKSVKRDIELSGTPAQIRWAESIRNELAIKYKHLKLPLHVIDSQFWINHRESDIEQIIADSYKITGPFVKRYPGHIKADAVDTLLQLKDFVAMDLETNDIGKKAQVIQIALVDNRMNILLDKLIKPLDFDAKRHDKSKACEINGITSSMIINAPMLPTVLPEIIDIVYNRNLVIFNADFDARVLRNSALKHGIFLPPLNAICAMLITTAWHESDFWLSLDEAIHYSGMRRTKNESAHSALGDALVTVRLLNNLRKQAKRSLRKKEELK